MLICKFCMCFHFRFNIVIFERDYDRLCHHSNNGAPLAKPLLQYADIIYDERCGAIVVPLGLLATPNGFKSITNRIMSLSLQFVKLWILLYNSENGRYIRTYMYMRCMNMSSSKSNAIYIQTYICTVCTYIYILYTHTCIYT